MYALCIFNLFCSLLHANLTSHGGLIATELHKGITKRIHRYALKYLYVCIKAHQHSYLLALRHSCAAPPKSANGSAAHTKCIPPIPT